ncbi:MAG: FAD-dependent monooxygenase [Nitratireductor sp.]
MVSLRSCTSSPDGSGASISSFGWDIDREREKLPENVIPRLKAMLGDDVKFELEWVSIYTFQCRRMEKFRYDHVIFAGDSAHQVSPFGARGANSGLQDVDNLGWKLKAVIDGLADAALLDTYDWERVYGADENILNSTRSTDFITPKSEMSRILRNAVLDLAEKHEFARPLVNSGRLSVPSVYHGSPLNGPTKAIFHRVPGQDRLPWTRQFPAAGCWTHSTAAFTCWRSTSITPSLLKRQGSMFAFLNSNRPVLVQLASAIWE